MNNSLIQVENLSLKYGNKEALHNISLNFDKYQIIALIGPSGSGKSTFLKNLNRMNDLIPDVKVSGKIKVDGNDIYHPQTDLTALRKNVGMVFQKANLFPLSVYENIVYGLRLSGENRKEILDKVVEKSLRQAAVWEETKDRLHKSALSFSGGQQQRMCIARVLAVSPDIILMDEPTSALDPISSSKIEETILELKKQYTIIVVTHNMQQASRISDKTAFFLDGSLIEFGSTKQIFLNPEKKETENYLNGKFG